MENWNLRATVALLLCLTFFLALTGCGKKNTEASDKTIPTTAVSENLPADTSESTSEKLLLDAIYRQNRLDALMLNHKSVQRSTVCMNTEGEQVFTAQVYGDRDTYAYQDSSGNISVIANGSEYGYDAEKGKPYMTSFYNNSYAGYANSNRNHVLFTGYNGETVIGAYSLDNESVVKTKVPMSEIDQSDSDFSTGETFTDNDTCIIEYHMIPYLYEIVDMQIYIIRADGSRVDLIRSKVTYDGPKYQAPSDLMARLKSGSGVDQRVVK